MSDDNNMSTDAYFLSWGSSVNVSEDLRRSIRTEIEEIDGSIRDLEANLKAEERTSSQLRKDQAHAQSEMVALERSMGDTLDASRMNEQVRKRLQDTQNAEILAPFDSATGRSKNGNSALRTFSSLSSTSNDDKRMELEAEVDSDKDPTKTIGNYEKYISERAAEKKVLEDMISKVVNELNQMNALTVSYEEEALAITKAIETEQLEQLLREAQNEEEARKKEQDLEFQRKRNTKEAVQHARAKCGEYAQQIADKTKVLTAMKRKHATEEEELAKRVAAAEEELRNLPSTSSLEAQVAFLENDIERLNGQVTEFESLQNARNAAKLEREQLKTKIETSKREEQIAKEKLANATKKCKDSEDALQKAQELALTAKAKKEANDTLETKEMHPGQAEQAELTKEKETLAEIINDLGQKSQIITKKSDSALEEVAKELITIEEEEKKIRKETEEVESSLNNLQSLREKSKAATQTEISELEKLSSNLEQAIAAEVSQMENIKQQKQKEQQEKEEHEEQETKKVKEALEEEHQLCLQAIDIVEKAKKVVEDLNGPVQLEDEEA